MKKARDASPNRALKHEREARCWSQLEVADHIGTTAFNVSRWERGITFPGSYFRQQLCLIFGKSPQELGFLSDEDAHEQVEQSEVVEKVQAAPERDEADEERASAVAVLSRSASAGTEALPVVWNVPYRRNPFFTGREATLQTLHTTFHAEEPERVQALAISGLGGIGKTQAALEYAYRYRYAYQAVLWARADTRELLITEFASIAALLALPESNEQDQQRAVTAVRRWLSRQAGWLLVLDNADDLEMVSDFLPEMPGGHLLLTTRARNTGLLARRLPMEKLSIEESVLFLLRRAKLLERMPAPDTAPTDRWLQARVVAEIMDGLPLALDQAAAYIEETDCGLSGYVERYQKHRMTLLSRRGGLRPDHPESIAAIWSLSFEKIKQTHPAAVELLWLCAFLHPDAIAEEILLEGSSALAPYLHLLGNDPLELDAAIRTLTTFSLLSRDPEQHILSLHRLVQIVLREQMNDETRQVWAERAVQVVERAFPTVGFTTWEQCQRCLPHALSCVECIEQFHLTHPAALSLLNKAGAYLRERAQYGEAERLLTNALTLSETTLAPDDALLAESLNNLGLLAHDQGKYIRSEDLLQRALAIYKQALGTEHVAVAQCLSNQAENYRVQAKHGQMELFVKEALAIYEKALGPQHPAVAKSLSQLATLYHSQGRYKLAEPLYRRALAIRQQVFGPEHVDVAENVNNLASLYHSLGKYTLAEPLYQQALAFCEKHLGTQHMYTASSLANLAEVYRAQGEYVRAEQLHQQALEMRVQTLGLNHPHVAKSLHLLAEIYLAQRKYNESEELALRALEIWDEAMGQEHNGAIGLDTLARLRRVQGRLAEAESLAMQAQAIFQRLWGNDSHTACSFNTLAEILADQQIYGRAEALLQQALQIQEDALGAEHPETARSLYNLAALACAQGAYTSARTYATRSLAIRQRTLKAQHPDLLAVQQQYEELLRMGEKALALVPEEEQAAVIAHTPV